MNAISIHHPLLPMSWSRLAATAKLGKSKIKEVMVDLAYKFCPNDDFNKNLVLLTLQIIDDSDEEDGEGDE